MNFIAAAEVRWPRAKVIGDGPYAVSTQNGGVVYLCMTESQQKSVALGCENPVMVNLRPINFDAIPDRMDADERRRARREARA